MAFVSDLLNYTKDYESPTSFWKWSSYATIAAVLRDNCWIPQGYSKMYGNIYVLNLADSAIQRKGKPVELSEKLVKLVNNTKIIAGRTSIQALLDELGRGETDAKTGKIIKGGSAIFYAPELSAGLVSDPQSVSILTDIYDPKDEYKELLRGRGTKIISKIVFSMFAASNEALLKAVYDKGAVHGGLLGRTFLVTPAGEFRKSNSLLDHIDDPEQFNKLVSQLKEIANLSGEIKLSKEAKKEYDDWYNSFRDSYKEKGDKSGIVGRLHTGVLKIAMILAVNEMSMEINQTHIDNSISECLALLPNYNTFVISSGRGILSEAGAILIQELVAAPGHQLSRKKIIRDHWHTFDATLLDSLVANLEQADLLKTEPMMNGTGVETYYRLTEKCLNTMGLKPKIKEPNTIILQ